MKYKRPENLIDYAVQDYIEKMVDGNYYYTRKECIEKMEQFFIELPEWEGKQEELNNWIEYIESSFEKEGK